MFGLRKRAAEEKWNANVAQWLSSGHVLGGNVGPNFSTTKEHKLCVRFAASYPDAAEFLRNKLRDPNPILAAYAFKCLIRVVDLNYEDIPADVSERSDVIEVQQNGCIGETKSFRQFVRDYFDLDPIEGFPDL